MDTLSLVLLCLALLLPFVSWWAAGLSKIDMSNHVSNAVEEDGRVLPKLLFLGGFTVSLGGIWIDWMLFLGMILIELGCIAYYLPSRRGK